MQSHPTMSFQESGRTATAERIMTRKATVGVRMKIQTKVEMFQRAVARVIMMIKPWMKRTTLRARFGRRRKNKDVLIQMRKNQKINPNQKQGWHVTHPPQLYIFVHFSNDCVTWKCPSNKLLHPLPSSASKDVFMKQNTMLQAELTLLHAECNYAHCETGRVVKSMPNPTKKVIYHCIQ